MIEGKRGCADTEKQRRDKLVQEDGKSGEAGELARSCAEPAGDCAEPQTDGGAPAVQQLEMELAQAKRRLAMLAQHVEELETEVADLKLENDRLYSDIADILSSSTWRMLAPFRSAVGWLRKNITGRLHAYRQLKKKKNGPMTLEMAAGLVKLEADRYQSLSTDPNFIYPYKLKRGLYQINWEGDCVTPLMIRIYPDFGDGMSEENARDIGWLDGASHKRRVYFEKDVETLRIDVGSFPVSFSLPVFRLRPLKGFFLRRPSDMSRTGIHMDENTTDSLSIEDYAVWARRHEPDRQELRAQREAARAFAYRPLISIVVPTYNTDRMMLEEMIRSVYAQTYDNWELCIADGGSSVPYIEEVLKQYDRVVYRMLGENRGIAGNSNAALALAKGEYIALLDHDDLLPAYALFEVVKAINEQGRPDVLYSDEDKFESDLNQRFEPHFKPDWSPELLCSCNYICHLFVARHDLILKTGGFLSDYDGSQDYDLILRATEMADKIVHIPKVLYHWRCHAASVAQASNAKPYAYESGKRAIRAHLQRMGRKAEVEYGIGYGYYRSIFELEERPSVSVIVHDGGDTSRLETCMEALFRHTDYEKLEVLVACGRLIDQQTAAYYRTLEARGVRIVPLAEGKEGYAAVNNRAAEQALGELLVFLESEVAVAKSGWLEELLSFGLRRDIGAAGAKISYPDGSVGHCGLIMAIDKGPMRSFEFLPKEYIGYAARTHIVQDVSGVSKDCMMVRRELFLAAGGFDETYDVCFYDADFCL